MVVAGAPNKSTFHGATSHKWSYIDHIKDHSAGNNIQIRVGETVKLSGALVASKS